MLSQAPRKGLSTQHASQNRWRTSGLTRERDIFGSYAEGYLHLNPHPCGYLGDLKRECRCSLNQVQRYRQRVSGPLLDRIDLHIEVPAVQFNELTSTKTSEPSSAIRERILAVRAIQQDRFAKSPSVRCNAQMGSRHLKVHCQIDEHSRELLKMAMTELNLSARAHDRILKVARTIADLEASPEIGVHHLSEAIQYRTLDRSLWA